MTKMQSFKMIAPGTTAGFSRRVSSFLSCHTLPVSKNSNIVVFPGFCDVHVHFREPGFSYKETILTGSMSAAAGGYTAVCTMPNLSPVPDSLDSLKIQLDLIERDSLIKVLPYGSITKNQQGDLLSDMDAMSHFVAGFSDDGRGVQSESVMREAMLRAKSLGKMIVAHCEDNSLLHGGYIHDGEYARLHSHKGICSESEWGPIERDLKLVEETGCAYHVCHISTKESVELIRQAKKKGLDVTCETGPHYLVLDDSSLCESGNFKMNPPLRSKSDREALVEGLLDGTIDMIATDHAPHSLEEKSKGLEKSSFGIVGLETAFPVLYTKLVMTGTLSLEKLISLMYNNPVERFSVPLETGFSVWDLSEEFTVIPENFLSKGRSTPFENERLFGRCLCTVYGDKIVYSAN